MRRLSGLILGIMAGILIGLAATAEDLGDLLPLAKAGNAEAQNSVGDMYADGNGVPQDYGEAAKWYRLAAEQGHDEAQNNLGSLYYAGDGVSQHFGEAIKWYRLAAEQGDYEAQYELGNMYYNGVGVPQNYILAHAWANIASANGYTDAQELRDSIASHLTPTLVVEAQKLAGCFQLGQALEECN